MQAGLTFQFPHNQKQVAVRIFVPQPECRPCTVANFAYMCTGELPPADMLSALRIPRTRLAFQTSAEAHAAGLKSFAETAVVRVEKHVMMEIGASTSKSIFGGFIPDERLSDPAVATGPTNTGATSSGLASIAATLPLLKAGTVLCGNVGMPDSHASRYYILLSDIKETERDNYACYAPLGMVTHGLEQLVASANTTPVQPRSLEPLKKVALTALQLDFSYQHLLAAGTHSLLSPNPLAGRSARAGDVERISGRVRRRDEDSEEEEEARAQREGLDSSPTDATVTGFFHFDAKFPSAGASGKKGTGQGPAAKRLRTESAIVAFDEYGEPILRNTAIPDDELNDDADDHDGTTTSEEKKPRGFNYFNAQEVAFLNDIETIKEKQQVRTYHKMNRIAKRAHATSKAGGGGGYGTQSARKIRERAMQLQESRSTSSRRKKGLSGSGSGASGKGKSSGGGGSAAASGRREVRKRY